MRKIAWSLSHPDMKLQFRNSNYDGNNIKNNGYLHIAHNPPPESPICASSLSSSSSCASPASPAIMIPSSIHVWRQQQHLQQQQQPLQHLRHHQGQSQLGMGANASNSCVSSHSLPSPSSSSSSCSSPALIDQNVSHLPLKIQGAQRTPLSNHSRAYTGRTIKPHNLPLSPQESSSNISNSTSATVCSVQTYALSHENPWMLKKDSFISDVPVMHATGSLISSALMSSRSPSADAHGANSRQRDADIEDRALEDTKRFKRTLAVLERELLGDDPDIETSCVLGAPKPLEGSLSVSTPWEGNMYVAKPSESDWTDIIKDYAPVKSLHFASLSVDQSTITSTSSTVAEVVLDGTVDTPQADASTRLKDLLLSCARTIDKNDLTLASSKVDCLEQLTSPYGDPMQRLAVSMVDGLRLRIEALRSGSHCVVGALQKFKDISPVEIMKATQSLYHFCPYFKFGYMAANVVIAEAFRNESRVHIVDFEIRQGNQWQALIRAFSQRPGGPPFVRLTGITDPKCPTSLEGVGQRLREIALQACVPFEFNALQIEAFNVKAWMLDRRPEDALAVNFPFQLHRMPDESVSMSNPRDTLLRMVKAMGPKVVTVAELDASTNTTPFYARFVETLSFFGAVFESLDGQLPRDSKLRVSMEQHCLARQVVNIIACEDGERTERFELAAKWHARMGMAGFRSLPLSPFISRTTREVLQPYSCNYKLREEDGALHLDWLDRGLVVASAWH